ncbi:MAG: SDR family oxidoreductase [Acidobacteriaceae bacterium]|nr:SDR family oxidoreductase [Acidobacteriaceae bacterium]MBV9304949.1 SDR family oxidoreductase [Acidobacteriaceae bacterium]
MARTLVAITGASSGIGAVFARKLAPEHDLLLIARRKEKLDELAERFTEQYGCHVDVLQADLASDEGQAAASDRIAREERLVLLVNNAGFGTKGKFWESPLEVQETMHRLHVMATVNLTHAALRNMVPKDRGGIINVASVSAFVRSPGTVSYAATKSWMTVFTEGLYLELQSVGSNVVMQALCPGFTYSEFHDAMGVNRERLAGSSFWMSPDYVVDQSLEGLARRKLFVIPNWRYRLISAFLTKIPTALRLKIEAATGRSRTRATELQGASGKQLS